MSNLEKNVRDLASKLSDAISSAEKAGYSVTWPRRASELKGIGVSQTKNFKEPPTKTSKEGSDKSAK
jgi:hypothetical protein